MNTNPLIKMKVKKTVFTISKMLSGNPTMGIRLAWLS